MKLGQICSVTVEPMAVGYVTVCTLYFVILYYYSCRHFYQTELMNDNRIKYCNSIRLILLGIFLV